MRVVARIGAHDRAAGRPWVEPGRPASSATRERPRAGCTGEDVVDEAAVPLERHVPPHAGQAGTSSRSSAGQGVPASASREAGRSWEREIEAARRRRQGFVCVMMSPRCPTIRAHCTSISSRRASRVLSEEARRHDLQSARRLAARAHPPAHPPDVRLIRRASEDRRAEGRDWPAIALTMVGAKRLDNLHACVETVLADGVPGDFIETGVWRGGSVILMRAILKAHDVTDRTVWVADSFAGVPKPDAERYPADAGDRHWTHRELAVSLEQVRANFARYGLLDDQVLPRRLVQGHPARSSHRAAGRGPTGRRHVRARWTRSRRSTPSPAGRIPHRGRLRRGPGVQAGDARLPRAMRHP